MYKQGNSIAPFVSAFPVPPGKMFPFMFFDIGRARVPLARPGQNVEGLLCVINGRGIEASIISWTHEVTDRVERLHCSVGDLSFKPFFLRLRFCHEFECDKHKSKLSLVIVATPSVRGPGRFVSPTGFPARCQYFVQRFSTEP